MIQGNYAPEWLYQNTTLYKDIHRTHATFFVLAKLAKEKIFVRCNCISNDVPWTFE